MTAEELEKLAQEIEAMKHDILTLCIPEPKCKAWAVASFEDAAARIRSKIVKPRIKRTFWMNVYPENDIRPYEDKYVADACESLRNVMGIESRRIACVKVEIDCEEGEGL